MAAVLALLISMVVFSCTPCTIDGTLQESTGGNPIVLGCEQEADAVAVDSSLQVLPLAKDSDVGFVHAPARTNRTFTPSKYSGKYRQDFDRPAMNRGVIDEDAALCLISSM